MNMQNDIIMIGITVHICMTKVWMIPRVDTNMLNFDDNDIFFIIVTAAVILKLLRKFGTKSSLCADGTGHHFVGHIWWTRETIIASGCDVIE